MEVAFSVWNHRVAPVFDVARQVHIVRTERGCIVSEKEQKIEDELPAQRALRLKQLGISTLVCGAISRQLLSAILAYGIDVVPFTAGDMRDVIQAYLSGTLRDRQNVPPGGPQHERHRAHCRGCRKTKDGFVGTRK